MKTNILKTAKNIHFIGIGGIGISAIARMFILEGKNVSGSDISETKAVDELKKLDADIIIGHSASNIPQNTDLVIYTIAINKNNPELNEAIKRNIKSTFTKQYYIGIDSIQKIIAIRVRHFIVLNCSVFCVKTF